MISKKMEVADLFAFYGELLTDKQKDVLTLYCLDDLSLGEIALDLKISRQGVYDTVKRASNILITYEDKLSLMSKFRMNTSLLNDINNKMIDLSNYINEDNNKMDLLKNKINNTIKIVIDDIENIIE